jgi:hypothetical protein
VFPGTALCPNCGAAIRPTVLPKPKPKKAGKVRRRLDVLSRRELIFGPASLVLLISFWLPWYSFSQFSISVSYSGLSRHGWLFIAVLDTIVLVLYVLITMFGAGDLADQGRLSKEQLLTALTGVNLVLVVLAFLLKPSGFSWAYGGFLALAAAIVAFLPFGVPLVQAQRQR